jgi:hypothetical protein
MWRAFIEAVVPFLIPFALYALWIAALKRSAPNAPAANRTAREYPWLALSAVGLVLAFLVLIITANRVRHEPGTPYAPARLENGRILHGGTPSR